MSSSTLSIETPRAFVPLLQPKRYKAAHGGRGSGKSHFFAELLIERCLSEQTRAACIREVQATIKDSVRQLLIDKIQKLGAGHLFKVVEGEIRGPHDSLIVFKGMQSYNAENIKSLEDFDIAWVEEAQTLSDHSLRLLRPTIRKAGSEIWFSWNPRHETDAVDQFFRGQKPPENAIIVPVNWYDNPWFPSVLIAEKEQDYAADPEMAEHVWGGGYQIITEASYYARHIAAAEKEGRVGYFPHDPSLPVYTSWDLGVDDYTAIWFWQVIGGVKPRVIDYYEASGIGADEIIGEALPEHIPSEVFARQAMALLDREQPFRYQRHFLPHDVRNREWGGGAKSRIQTLVGLGVNESTINVGVQQDPEERINATRRLLPIVEFHQTARVMKGVQRLRRFSRKLNRALGTYLGPLHDENSHGSDAFGEFAVNCGLAPPPIVAAAPEPQPANMHEMTYEQLHSVIGRREEGIRA